MKNDTEKRQKRVNDTVVEIELTDIYRILNSSQNIHLAQRSLEHILKLVIYQDTGLGRRI